MNKNGFAFRTQVITDICAFPHNVQRSELERNSPLFSSSLIYGMQSTVIVRYN